MYIHENNNSVSSLADKILKEITEYTLTYNQVLDLLNELESKVKNSTFKFEDKTNESDSASKKSMADFEEEIAELMKGIDGKYSATNRIGYL